MSLTTVSSASFLNLNNIPVPRVFGLGLGRGASPPPSPPPTRRRVGSSSPRKRPSSPNRAQLTSPTQPRPSSNQPRVASNQPRPVSNQPRTTSNQPRPSSRQPHTPTNQSRTPTNQPRTPRTPTAQPRPTFARIRHRRRAPTVSSISTLSSLISETLPPPTEVPPPPSLTAALRTLEKLKIPNTDRVEGWRVGVAHATGSEPMGGAGSGTGNVESTTGEGVEPGAREGVAESQDLQSLSDEDIFALTQNIKNEEASRRPLVSPISPLTELRAEFSPLSDATGEYTGPNANVLRKIDWLQKHGGWNGIRRTRGDGDCFYRSLAFAYVEKIMSAAEPGLAVATSLSHLESTLPLLEQAGFQRIVFEDFYECLAELIQQIVPSTGKPPLTNTGLLEQFQNPEISNSIVVFLRLLTSSYIRLSPEDDFAPFLFHPDTGDMVDVRTFVEMFVEATGREADHPQIMALSKALRVRIEVAYLDNSSGTAQDDGTVRVDFVKFAPEGAEEDGTKPVVLLYRRVYFLWILKRIWLIGGMGRPGHYDTLEEKVEG